MRARITALIIVMGLLVQAFALVRHNATVIGNALGGDTSGVATSGIASLMRDLVASICHPAGGGDTAALPGSDRNGDSPTSSCPVCNGLVSAYGLPAPDSPVLEMRLSTVIVAFQAFDERVRTHRFIRPQSRGPPVLI